MGPVTFRNFKMYLVPIFISLAVISTYGNVMERQELECGDKISSDCRSECDNALRNGNLDHFYNRCETEGGSQPLRKRCSLCCDGCEPPEPEGSGEIDGCGDDIV